MTSSTVRAGALAACVAGVLGGCASDQLGREGPLAIPAVADRASLGPKAAAALARLDPLVGEWAAEGTMGPKREDGTRARQAGTWSNRWILDGRHMELRFDVEVEGRANSYVCLLSYNPVRERYESTWVGSSGFRFMETGNFDAAGDLVLTSFQDRSTEPVQLRNDSVFRFLPDGSITVTDTLHLDSGPDEQFHVRLVRSGH